MWRDPLADTFEATYDRLLVEMSGHVAALPDEVCLDWPMHEPSYTGRLLIAGQSLNGWGHMAACPRSGPCAPSPRHSTVGMTAPLTSAARGGRDGRPGHLGRGRAARAARRLPQRAQTHGS